MQEGRTNGLSRLKGEKALGITKNAKRKEKRRMNEGEERNAPGAWMRGEERKNESTKGRERGESRVGGGPDPVDTTTTTNITTATSTTMSTMQDRARNLVSTRMHTPIHRAGSSRFFFSDFTCSLPLFLSLSTLSPYSSPDFFTPRALDAILRGNIPLRWVDFLTLTLARTYCLS